MSDETALKRDLSAEIHALARMGVTANDTVVLYSSETPDGQACAAAVKLYLDNQLEGIVCRIHVIEGLQVHDAQTFRTKGVLNFTKAVLAEIQAQGAEQCILNPTGGFKSLVPYTVLIGMLKGVPARYIFEQSSALIDLPMMPVEFARSRLEPLRPLLDRIDQESAITRTEYETAVAYHEREMLSALFEDLGDGQITLSPVGFLIREDLQRPISRVPFLSRRALNDLLKLSELETVDPEGYLKRVAGSPAQLDANRHINLGNDLFWLKPGQHTRVRYLVSVEGWRLLVWRLCDHKEYETLIDQKSKRDIGARILDERRSQYEPFVRMEFYSG
nr:putative CRISPR-associated protein [Halochromatium roseum]